MKTFAAAKGYPLVDFYNATVDPATGALKRQFYAPVGHHLTRAGHTACAAAFLTAVARELPRFQLPTASYEGDPSSLVHNGVALVDSDGDGLPDGWSVYPANRAAGVTLAIRSDPRFRGGRALEIDARAGQGVFQLYLTVTAATTKVAPRDWLLLVARFSIETSTGYPPGTENPGFGIGIEIPGSFPWVNHYVEPPIVPGDSHAFAGVAHVPAATAVPVGDFNRTNVRPLFTLDNLPAGQRLKVRIGDVQLFNATALGLLDPNGQPIGTPLWCNVNPGPVALAAGALYYP